jgi:hypothetical protein
VTRRTTIIALSVCLLISFSLNLFAAGAWFAGRWIDSRIERSISRVLQPYPPALRREIVRNLREDRAELLASARDFRASRQRLFAAMRAEPLDRDALTAAMTDVRAKTDALQALLQSNVAKSLETVPAAERQQIQSPGLGLGLFDEVEP